MVNYKFFTKNVSVRKILGTGIPEGVPKSSSTLSVRPRGSPDAVKSCLPLLRPQLLG